MSLILAGRRGRRSGLEATAASMLTVLAWEVVARRRVVRRMMVIMSGEW